MPSTEIRKVQLLTSKTIVWTGRWTSSQTVGDIWGQGPQSSPTECYGGPEDVVMAYSGGQGRIPREAEGGEQGEGGVDQIKKEKRISD